MVTAIETKRRIESIFAYREALNEILKELDLTESQSRAVRTLLIACKGEVKFEASQLDLAKIAFKYDAKDGYPQNSVNKVSRDIRELREWQDKNQLNLVEIIEVGSRPTNKKTGKFEYIKSKYKFVLLAELAQAIDTNPDNLKAVAKRTITKLKEVYAPSAKTRRLSPNQELEKTRKTIISFLRNAFRLAENAGKAPYKYCQEILVDCRETILGLNRSHKLKMNRERFIYEFEGLLGQAPTENLDVETVSQ